MQVVIFLPRYAILVSPHFLLSNTHTHTHTGIQNVPDEIQYCHELVFLDLSTNPLGRCVCVCVCGCVCVCVGDGSYSCPVCICEKGRDGVAVCELPSVFISTVNVIIRTVRVCDILYKS